MSETQTLKNLAAETSPQGGPDRDTITLEQFAAAYAPGRLRTEHFLISRGCSSELAEEMAQAAWTKGWEHHAKLREPEKVANWVNTIAFNLFRSQFRKREFAVETPEIATAPETGPGAIDVQRALKLCDPTERALLQKHYSAGYSSTEIAQQMNCSAITVRVRLLRLRRRLRMTMTAAPIAVRQNCA